MKKNINYTPEDFYDFGKRQLSQAAIARFYGIKGQTVAFQLKKPDLRKAYDAGLKGESLRLQPTIPDEQVLPTDAEIEQAILAAIDAHCCTQSQIRFHAKFAVGVDFFSVIEGMLEDKKIKESSNGTIEAYFRHDWNVKKFWLTGETKLGIEFANEQNLVKSPSPNPKNTFGGSCRPEVVVD